MNLITELEPMLVAAIQYWLAPMTTLFTSLKDDQGNKLTGPVTIYSGFLPTLMSGDVNPAIPSLFPHVIVQLSEFDLGFDESSLMAKLLIGTWDDNEDYSGYQGVLRIMETISGSLYFERILGNKFPLKGRVKGKMVQGSELWPQFFGLMDIEFEGPLFVSRMEGIQEVDALPYWPNYVVNPGKAVASTPYETGS